MLRFARHTTCGLLTTIRSLLSPDCARLKDRTSAATLLRRTIDLAFAEQTAERHIQSWSCVSATRLTRGTDETGGLPRLVWRGLLVLKLISWEHYARASNRRSGLGVPCPFTGSRRARHPCGRWERAETPGCSFLGSKAPYAPVSTVLCSRRFCSRACQGAADAPSRPSGIADPPGNAPNDERALHPGALGHFAPRCRRRRHGRDRGGHPDRDVREQHGLRRDADRHPGPTARSPAR